MDNMHSSKKSFFDALSGKSGFVLGLFAGLFIVSTIGFFILLGSSLGDGKGGGTKTADPSPSAPTPTAPAPTKAAGDVVPVSDRDYIKGNKDAKVTIIEYSDYECPYCKRFHPSAQQAVDEYDGQVNWVFRHFPLSFHPAAQPAAEGAECVGELGGADAFWKYTDTLFDRMPGVTKADLAGIAEESGVDKGKFEECLNSGKYAEALRQSTSEGQKAGVTGTPGTILINQDGETQLIPGAVPYATLKSAIDSLL